MFSAGFTMYWVFWILGFDLQNNPKIRAVAHCPPLQTYRSTGAIKDVDPNGLMGILRNGRL